MNGLKLSSRSFKDWDWGKIRKDKTAVDFPINRDISNVPVVYQGTVPSCVSCAVTWLKQYMELSKPDLSWEWLAQIAGTNKDGATLSSVLEAARKTGICKEEVYTGSGTEFEKSLDAANHKLPAYAYVMAGDIQSALTESPLLITVNDYNGSGAHCMVLTDIIRGDDGEMYYRGVNWDSSTTQGQFTLPINTRFCDVVIPISDVNSERKTMSILSVLYSKAQNILSLIGKKGVVAALAALFLSAGVAGQQFGNAGVATAYKTVIAGSGISSSATSIPVSSVTLYTGEQISTSTLIFPVYLFINQGGQTQEQVECWNLSTTTTNPTYTGCVRGLSALGGATSTVSGAAKAHSPGENVIMSNTGPFYNRFVDIYTTQRVNGLKTFANATTTFGDSTGSIIWMGGATNKLGWTDDGINTFTFAAGSSGLTASSTKGICVIASQIGINVGSSCGVSLGGGLTFSGAGALNVAPSSTALLFIDSDGRLAVSSTALGSSPSIVPPGYFGDGSGGASTTAVGTTTLTGDVYFTTYVVSTGTTLLTNGFRVFANISLTNNGVISCDGATGTNGGAMSTTSTGGNGCGSSVGTLPAGLPGGYGAGGTKGGTSITGGAGSSTNLAIVTTASVGGAGGAGDPAGAGGAGGAGGTTLVAATNLPRNYSSAISLMNASGTSMSRLNIAPSAGGGGSGGGASGGSGNGGDGGGAGGNGGMVFLASPTITNNWIISVRGGQGGNGGVGQTGGGGSGNGGGGGGSGGNGGIAIFIYKTLVGNSPLVTGGAGGSGGAGTGTAVSGSNGNTGVTGQFFQITN